MLPYGLRTERSPKGPTGLKVVWVLRFVHGLAVALGTKASAHRLADVLDAGGLHSSRPSYVALYTGLVAVNLFIAWTAWRRFGRRSLRAAIVSYAVWIPLFVWHGWYTDAVWAPYQLYTDCLMAPDQVFARFWEIFFIAGFYFSAYALFPVLCYLDKRHVHR
jgi:hypothetical protein